MKTSHLKEEEEEVIIIIIIHTGGGAFYPSLIYGGPHASKFS